MRQQFEPSLKQLKTEFEAGQKMSAELEAKHANVHKTMLRLSSAVVVR